MSQSESLTSERRRPRSRLSVALEPVLPNRAVEAVSATNRYGYDLRVRGGERLSSSHPLLGAFGATIATLTEPGWRRRSLQDPAFDPGREVRLVTEPDDDGARAVGVWDADQHLYAGRLDYESGALVLAAEEYGTIYEAVVLDEYRNTGTGIRGEIRVFVFRASQVTLSLGRLKPYIGAPAPRRQALLVVEPDGCARWWEDDTRAGPIALEDMTLSPAVRDADRKLQKAARKLKRVRDSYDPYGELRRRAQKHFDRCAERLWLCVHREFAADHLVGFMGPSMTEPCWVPNDLSNQKEDSDHVDHY